MVEDHRKAVGDRLRDLRKSRNMSQMDAAIAVGVQLKTWGDWERGKRDPYDVNWRRIGEAFDVDPAEVRGTPPAPLGMGAREDTVEGVREFFAEKVDRHDATLAENNRLLREQAAELQGARLDRQAIQELVARQNEQIAAQTELLNRQTELIEEMRKAQAALLEAARRQIERATEEQQQGEWDGVERRRDERRHSG